MVRRFLAVLAMAVVVGCGESDETRSATPDVAAPEGPFTYALYEEVLSAHVDEDGMVDYAALKQNVDPLHRFIAGMGAVEPEEFAAWSREEQLAFWINAYNAITLKYIVDHYPIESSSIVNSVMYPAESIRQIDGVWNELTTRVVGKERTLDAIEHEILRKEFDEPRIHAALVCAAMGCPPLRSEPFIAEELEGQLADQSRRFLADKKRFRIDRNANIVHVSSIFEWFGDDFVAKYTPAKGFAGHNETEKAFLNFASQYVSEEDAAYLREGDYDVRFIDYDWTLNDQKLS